MSYLCLDLSFEEAITITEAMYWMRDLGGKMRGRIGSHDRINQQLCLEVFQNEGNDK